MVDQIVRTQFTTDGQGNVVTAFSQGADAADKFAASATAAGSAQDVVATGAARLKDVLVSLAAAWATDQILDSTRAMQGYVSTLTVATGSHAAAAKEMQFLTGVADQYGLQLDGLASGYARMSVAAQNSSLSQAQLRDLLTATARASSVLQLGQEKDTEILGAYQQMLDRGTVSSQQLVRMLGTSLPGAFGLAAQAMGVTTAKLKEMLASGEVAADELLPRFAEQLTKLYGTTNTSGDIAQPLNRLSTALTEIKVTLGDGAFGQSAAANAELIASALKSASDSGDSFNSTIKLTEDALIAVAAVIGGQWIGSLYTSTAALIQKTVAARADALEALQLAQANATAADANLVMARSALQAQAAIALETGDTLAAASALGAYTAATAEAATAQETLAAAEAEASLGAGAFETALGFLGGLPGVIFLGVAAFAALALNMKDAGQEADDLDAKIRQTAGDLDSFAQLTKAQELGLIDLKTHEIAKFQDQQKGLQDRLFFASDAGDNAVPMTREQTNDVSAQLDTVNQKLALANKQLQDFNGLYLGLLHTGSQLPALDKLTTSPVQMNDLHIEHPGASNQDPNKLPSDTFPDDWAQSWQQKVQLVNQLIASIHPAAAVQQQIDAVNALVGTTVDGYTVTAKDAELYIEKLKQKSGELDEFTKEAAKNMQDALATFLFDPFQGGLDGMVKSFAKAVQQMIAQAEAAAILKKLFGAYDSSGNNNGGAGLGALLGQFFGSAQGNVFDQGALVPFASGGIFDSPQFFPMASGGVGVFAEAGPEAIMPLTRGPGGSLGVKSYGHGGGGNVYSPTFQVDARGTGGVTQADLQAMAMQAQQAWRMDLMTFSSTGQFAAG